MDCHAYLAPYECHTIYFLKAIIQGTKKFVGCDNVRYLSLPQYEGLGIREILEQAIGFGVVNDYLPDPEEFRKLPRQWLINVTYTLVGQPFADWAKAIIEARNQKLVDEQKLAIDMDPQILQFFTQSTAVSSKYLPIGCIKPLAYPLFVVSCSSEGQWRLPAEDRVEASPQAGRHPRAEPAERVDRDAVWRAGPTDLRARAGACASQRGGELGEGGHRRNQPRPPYRRAAAEPRWLDLDVEAQV